MVTPGSMYPWVLVLFNCIFTHSYLVWSQALNFICILLSLWTYLLFFWYILWILCVGMSCEALSFFEDYVDAHAHPCISLIRCFAMPLTHFWLSQFLCFLFSCCSTIWPLQVFCLFPIYALLLIFCVLNDFEGVRMPCLCTLYSNAIILIGARTLGSFPISFKHSFALLHLFML